MGQPQYQCWTLRYYGATTVSVLMIVVRDEIKKKRVACLAKWHQTNKACHMSSECLVFSVCLSPIVSWLPQFTPHADFLCPTVSWLPQFMPPQYGWRPIAVFWLSQSTVVAPAHASRWFSLSYCELVAQFMPSSTYSREEFRIPYPSDQHVVFINTRARTAWKHIDMYSGCPIVHNFSNTYSREEFWIPYPSDQHVVFIRQSTDGLEMKNNGSVKHRTAKPFYTMDLPSSNTYLPLTLLPSFGSPKVIPRSSLFLYTGCPSIQYSNMAITCHCTLQGCGEIGGRQPKNRMLSRIKLISLKWPTVQLNVLLRINLKQSGSILLLPLSRAMYLHLHQRLFQVEGCGPMHNEGLFPTQTMSRQLIHLHVEISSVISSVDWVK